jgi:DNA-directed RNA polymerase sigma subunit (sigma70/sigma32)
MHDRPTALELIEAVTEFLSAEVLPAAADHRLKFRTLVALNALGIAYRELSSASNSQLLAEDEVAELARRIRSGDVPEDSLQTLKAHVAAKLRVSNPAYLERYE